MEVLSDHSAEVDDELMQNIIYLSAQRRQSQISNFSQSSMASKTSCHSWTDASVEGDTISHLINVPIPPSQEPLSPTRRSETKLFRTPDKKQSKAAKIRRRSDLGPGRGGRFHALVDDLQHLLNEVKTSDSSDGAKMLTDLAAGMDKISSLHRGNAVSPIVASRAIREVSAGVGLTLTDPEACGEHGRFVTVDSIQAMGAVERKGGQVSLGDFLISVKDTRISSDWASTDGAAKKIVTRMLTGPPGSTVSLRFRCAQDNGKEGTYELLDLPRGGSRDVLTPSFRSQNPHTRFKSSIKQLLSPPADATDANVDRYKDSHSPESSIGSHPALSSQASLNSSEDEASSFRRQEIFSSEEDVDSPLYRDSLPLSSSSPQASSQRTPTSPLAVSPLALKAARRSNSVRDLEEAGLVSPSRQRMLTAIGGSMRAATPREQRLVSADTWLAEIKKLRFPGSPPRPGNLAPLPLYKLQRPPDSSPEPASSEEGEKRQRDKEGGKKEGREGGQKEGREGGKRERKRSHSKRGGASPRLADGRRLSEKEVRRLSDRAIRRLSNANEGTGEVRRSSESSEAHRKGSAASAERTLSAEEQDKRSGCQLCMGLTVVLMVAVLLGALAWQGQGQEQWIRREREACELRLAQYRHAPERPYRSAARNPADRSTLSKEEGRAMGGKEVAEEVARRVEEERSRLLGAMKQKEAEAKAKGREEALKTCGELAGEGAAWRREWEEVMREIASGKIEARKEMDPAAGVGEMLRTLAAKAMQVSCLEEGNEGEDREKGEKGRTGEGMRERMRKAFVRREDTQHTTQS